MLDHSYRVLSEMKRSVDLNALRSMSITTTNNTALGRDAPPLRNGRALASRPRAPEISGDHIWKVTPVPIPNTVVKLPEPMVVPKARE